jgi:hypothetical protein
VKQADIDRAMARFDKLRAKLKLIYESCYHVPDGIEEEYTDIMTALKCLREARERAEGCEYCAYPNDDCDTTAFHTRPDWREISEFLNDRNDCIPSNYCPNCGRRLEADDDLQDYTDTPEAWAKRRIDGQLSGNSEQVKEESDDDQQT